MAVYIASRASVPERSALWRSYRGAGVPITSTWIDEAGEGETGNYFELWDRITAEITAADRLVLYAEPDDFPLKGALIEAGIAIGMGKPVIVCLPGVELAGRTMRPIGSWIAHRLVTRNDDIAQALTMTEKITNTHDQGEYPMITKSDELADHFLRDKPQLNNEENRTALTAVIQTAMEEWVEFATKRELGNRDTR